MVDDPSILVSESGIKTNKDLTWLRHHKVRIVLVGDSIRLGYAPVVTKLLAGQADVLSPAGAGDSRWLRGTCGIT